MEPTAKVLPRIPRTPFGWFAALGRHRRDDYVRSDRSQKHARPWEDGFDPDTNPVYAHNAIDIEVPVARVFGALANAVAWPRYYPNASNVVIEQGRETELRQGSRFEWTTFGTRQKSEVTLFEANVALGWTAESPGTHAYHRWILEPSGTRTRVITEECQHGLVARLDQYWMSRSLHAAHQLWLETLRDCVTRA